MITTHPDDVLATVAQTPLSDLTIEEVEGLLRLLDRLEGSEEEPVPVARFGSVI